MNQNWEKPTYISWSKASLFTNHFSLARLLACSLARVKLNLWLEMIGILIINFGRFDWISAVSRKVLFLLESALRHFEVLKFLWQLNTTSQDQSSEKGPVHIQVSLKCTSNALQVHLKSPVWIHLMLLCRLCFKWIDFDIQKMSDVMKVKNTWFLLTVKYMNLDIYRMKKYSRYIMGYKATNSFSRKPCT